VVRVLGGIEPVCGAVTAEALEPRVVHVARGRVLGLVERDQRAEEVRGLTAQPARLREAMRHVRREVALPLHHQLQVVGRAQRRLLGERAEREAVLLRLSPRIERAQERAEVAMGEDVDGSSGRHPQKLSR
jgi:hypothetical protein